MTTTVDELTEYEGSTRENINVWRCYCFVFKGISTFGLALILLILIIAEAKINGFYHNLIRYIHGG